jgi:hypothetical protein
MPYQWQIFAPMVLYLTGAVIYWRNSWWLARKHKEKGGTFTYDYLLVAFTMLKWMPPTGRPLVSSR